MSDFRFNCPNCGQHLLCESGYAGYHVQCPQCNGGVVIPRRLDNSGRTPGLTAQADADAGPATATPGSKAGETAANDLRFDCPHCGNQLECGANYAGHHVRCPCCYGGLVVPRPLRLAQPEGGQGVVPRAANRFQPPVPPVYPGARASQAPPQHRLSEMTGSVLMGLVQGMVAVGSAISLVFGVLFAGCTILFVGEAALETVEDTWLAFFFVGVFGVAILILLRRFIRDELS